MIASALGLGLGFMLAHRIRTNRLAFYRAMRTAEKPTHLLFANGKKTEIPDMTPLLRPSRFGDFAAYTFFSAGGLFVFGELGLLIGSWWAKRSILKDEGTRKRIDEAFRAFRLDVLKKEAKELESGKGERAW